MPYKDPDQQREYVRLWVAKRRSDFLQDKVCAQCGSGEDLQLDHIDAKLKIDHRIWSWSEERRLAEIAKCQILCHTCHKKKTALMDMPRTSHGTGRMYQTYKCRCVLCVAKKARDDKKYRSKEWKAKVEGRPTVC